MKKTRREKLTNALILDMENLDRETLLGFAQDARREQLDRMSDTEIESEAEDAGLVA